MDIEPSMNRFTFTFDLEEHMPHRRDAPRFHAIVEKLLVFLEQRQVNGTFFVVGKLARDHPDLIKKIHQAGHEIGFHSWGHKQLSQETPESFAKGNLEGKHILEQIIGESVIGYRAPVFSLTPATAWAVEILKDQGFRYSSSILPAKNPLHGFADAPKIPFQWWNGLIEIPVPVIGLGPMSIPFLGGFYLRYLPRPLLRHICNSGQNQHLWSYVHPYDFDPEEKFGRIAGASWFVSFLLWINRANTFQKLDSVLNQFTPPHASQNTVQHSFAHQIARNDFANLPRYCPE